VRPRPWWAPTAPRWPPACRTCRPRRPRAPQVGISYTIAPTAQFVQPNFTAQCEVMAQSKAEAYYFSSAVPGVEQMAGNCLRQGFSGFWVLPQAS
jgi:hypothetical protein